MKVSKDALLDLKNLLVSEIESHNDKIGYEDVLPNMFKRYKFSYELVDDLSWTEIDFYDDVIKAENLAIDNPQ